MNYKVIHDMLGVFVLSLRKMPLDDSYNIEYTLENNNFIEKCYCLIYYRKYFNIL